MAIATRPASKTDLPSLLALYRQLHPDDTRLLDEDARRIWDEIVAQPGRTVLVAELNGAVVGTADCAVLANLTRGGRPFMLIENVVVDTLHRRRGIGSRLLEGALALARTAGCQKMQLLSHLDRTEAHALYESCGFLPVARGYRRYLE